MKFVIAALASAAGAFFLPIVAIDALARLLILAIALMATGIFPCMTLTVTAMKGEHRTPALVEALYEKLRALLQVLVAAFVLAVFSVLALLFTMAVIAAVMPELSVKIGAAVSTALIVLFAGRVSAIGRAFFALLEINKKHALMISRGAVRDERNDALEAGKIAKFTGDKIRKKKLRKVS